MQTPESEVISAVREWLHAGRTVHLMTVVRTWGSSPRPPGALWAVSDDGDSIGSVSGGCVERELGERLCQAPLERPVLWELGVTRKQALRLGLPCGGRLDLVAEPVTEATSLSALQQSLQARRVTERRVCLNTGEVSLHPAARARETVHFDGRTLRRFFGPVWRLLLVGAGELAAYVADMALALGFEVVVCDPREQAPRWWSHDQVPLCTDMPDDLTRTWANDARCAVVTLAHDPKLDDLALLEALQSEAFYVGALGSKATSAARRKRLASLGVDAFHLARLHAPVGLALGARGVAEIAVSVAAGLVRARHRSDGES